MKTISSSKKGHRMDRGGFVCEAVRPHTGDGGAKSNRRPSLRFFFAGISSVALLACCAGLISSSSSGGGGSWTASLEALQASEQVPQLAVYSGTTFGLPTYRESAALRVACASCAKRILSKHLPWKEGSMLDPEDALSCSTQGACSAAATQAAELALSHPSERLCCPWGSS